MQENDSQNAAFYWSTLFVRALFEEGVRHAVISPGSRSTALTLAFAAHQGFQSHVLIDERSAAFTALGIAKATGIPAVLVCTSGTAVANYYPAVIEAAQSGVPMIIASADRPPHSRGIGASQTIDQIKIFGDYPVFFHEAGEPSSSEESLQRLKTAAIQAVTIAKTNRGVAHLNFPFSKPFEPGQGILNQIEKENQKHSKTEPSAYTCIQHPQEMGETFWSDLISAERPLIIVGPASSADDYTFVKDLAKVLKSPLIAEPGSNLGTSKHIVHGYEGFLRNGINHSKLKPDLILRFGFQPVSKALNLLLEECKDVLQVSFFTDSKWNDGSLSSHKQIMLKAPLLLPEINGAADKSWMQQWKHISLNFEKTKITTLSSQSTLSDGFVFSELSKIISKKSFCMLSNSFPVRDMAMFGSYIGKNVHVNRGAAGIDGVISTAMGLSIGRQTKGVLFIGDVAFLHDSNALLNSRLINQNLVIVVLNNGGGTIFRMLPVYKIRDKYTRFFETPQQTNIAALCRAHKVEHALVSQPEQLIPAFEKMMREKGLQVLECVTDANISMQQREELWNFEMAETE